MTSMTGESQTGIGSRQLQSKPLVMGQEGSEMLEDKYGFEKDTSKLDMDENEDEDDKVGAGESGSILDVFDKTKVKEAEGLNKGPVDLKGGIKYKDDIEAAEQ